MKRSGGVAALATVAVVLAIGGAASAGETPVLLSLDEACQVTVDGETIGTLPAGTNKKIGLPPGEHVVTSVCGDRRSKQIVSVGEQQKVVNIPPVDWGDEPAPAPKAEARGRTGLARVAQRDGRWTVMAVIKGSPAHAAGVRPGSILTSVDGRRAKDLTLPDLESLDEGAAGSSVTAEILDRDDQMQTITVTRGEVPESGLMEVLSLDGKSIEERAFDPATRDTVAGVSVLPVVPLGGLAGSSALKCLKCKTKPRVGASMYCVDHKCQNLGCMAQEALGGDYCPLHKCSVAFCKSQKAWGSDKCALHAAQRR